MTNINITKTFYLGDSNRLPSKITLINQTKYIGIIYRAYTCSPRCDINPKIAKFIGNYGITGTNFRFKCTYFCTDIDWNYSKNYRGI